MGLNAKDLLPGKVYNVQKYDDTSKDYTIYTVRYIKRNKNTLVFNNTLWNVWNGKSDDITVEVDNDGFSDHRSIITSTGIIPGVSKTIEQGVSKTIEQGGSKKSRKQRKSKKQRKQRKQRKSKTTKKNKNIIF